MSDDPSTALLADDEPRPGRPGLFLTGLAALALAVSVFAILRSHSLGDRLDSLAQQTEQLDAALISLTADLTALADQEARADSEIRGQLESLLSLSRDVAALEATTAELQDRAALPQRSWARAEALALLELASRQLKVERNIDAAVEAMATADARLAQLREPALDTVRRQLTAELETLRAFPRPDLAGITEQLREAETTAEKLTARGIVLDANGPGLESGTSASSGLARAWLIVKSALANLVTLRSTASQSGTLVTLEEQDLKRQRLQLLLLEARIAVARADQPAFAAAVAAARGWLGNSFNSTDPDVARLALELEALQGIDVAPTLPDVSSSLRLLEQLVPLTRPGS